MMSETKEGAGPAEGLHERDLLMGLVQSFQAAAMQQMGKVMNPFTQKIERDMAHAKMSIEMLEMLRAKTSGNLTGQEARFLNHVLTELRLNYVAEADRDKADAGKSAPEAATAEKSAPEAATAEKSAPEEPPPAA